jgi:hypothetical protein
MQAVISAAYDKKKLCRKLELLAVKQLVRPKDLLSRRERRKPKKVPKERRKVCKQAQQVNCCQSQIILTAALVELSSVPPFFILVATTHLQ